MYKRQIYSSQATKHHCHTFVSYVWVFHNIIVLNMSNTHFGGGIPVIASCFACASIPRDVRYCNKIFQDIIMHCKMSTVCMNTINVTKGLFPQFRKSFFQKNNENVFSH